MSEIAELAAELVRIDSVNPDLIPGGAGEARVAAFVADWLRGAGLEVTVLEERPGRPSVIGVARGSGGGRTLMLNAHTDTVGVDDMDGPFAARRDGDRLYGRGAYDMKGALAACMVAARDASRLGLRGDVVVAAAADEEVGSLGTEEVLRRLVPDACIVAEPTDMTLGVAHRGFVGFEVEVTGRAAHGSRPDLGIDAIAKMGRVLVGVEELDRRLRAEPTHRYLGSGSLHASIVRGGQEYSSYPERCVLSAERRTIPGETVAHVEAEIAAILERAASRDPDFRATYRAVLHRDPFEAAGDSPLASLVRRHAGGPETTGQAYWADSALCAAAGADTVLFGPGGEGAHATVEWVSIADLERCAALYAAVAAELCA